MKFTLGVDAGGTKTAVCILPFEYDGPICGVGPGINLNTASDIQASQLLRETLRQTLNGTGLSLADCAYCLCGFAGADAPQNQELMRKVLETAGLLCPIEIKNDISSLLEYCVRVSGESSAMILSSGTGSICRALWNERIYTVGGYGSYFGDEGSGYWMGREVLRLASCMEDGRVPKTSLYQQVLNLLGASDMRQAVQRIRQSPSQVGLIASAAPLAGWAADNGDMECAHLLVQAAEELCRLFAGVMAQAPELHPSKLWLMGSNIQKQPKMLAILREKLYALKYDMQLCLWTKEPAVCNAELAKAKVGS